MNTLTHERLLLPVPGQSFRDIRGLVARILLRYAGSKKAECTRLAHRDIARMLGIDWQMVHLSLKSLQEQGAIRIDHSRIFVNKGLLLEMASGIIR